MAKNQKNSRTNYDNIETDGQPSNSTIIAARNLPDRWEYVLVTFHDYRGWRPRYINGHELSDWMNNPVIHEYIEKMAEDGWEIAAASSGVRMYGSGDNHQVYFRHLKTS